MEKENTPEYTEEQLQELENELQSVCVNFKEDYVEFKKFEKRVNEHKARLKELFKKTGKNMYQDDFVKCSQTVVDKSYLDEARTINYLREKGLEKYIHTKEYFDETELIMASSNGELEVKDLAEFKVEKQEIRINVK